MSLWDEEGKLLHRRYAVRTLEKATRDVEKQIQELAEWNGTEETPMPAESVRLALEWHSSFQEAMLSLRDFPSRCPLISERNLFSQDVHQLLFRRSASAPAWRMLFVIEEESEDGPLVQVIHVRHGSRRPITRKEAREMPLRD
jgi:hypothetical protein